MTVLTLIKAVQEKRYVVFMLGQLVASSQARMNKNKITLMSKRQWQRIKTPKKLGFGVFSIAAMRIFDASRGFFAECQTKAPLAN